MASIWVGHAVQLAGASPVVIGSITNMGLPQGLELSAEPTAGSPYPRITTIRSKRPTANITTRNIQAALALVGSTSLAIKSGGTYTGIEFYQARLDDCGRPAAGSVHRKIAFDFGCLLPRTLSCSAGQDAEISLEFIGLSSDGAASPITITESVALPTLPSDERHTIGPVTLESITIDRLQQLSVDFGLTANSQQLDTAIFPTHIAVDSQVSRVTFSSPGLDQFGDSVIPEGGLAVEHANTEIWFRQRQYGADALFADTAEKHLLLTCSGLAYIEDAMAASGNAPATLSGAVTCRHDGSNAPIVITTDTNIEDEG